LSIYLCVYVSTRTGKLTTIIFLRDYNTKGQEVSGYIDLAHRMRTEGIYLSIYLSNSLCNSLSMYLSLYLYLSNYLSIDFVPIFDRRKKLLPKPSDLSYYNWETQVCIYLSIALFILTNI
jgi:hypothetical protein